MGNSFLGNLVHKHHPSLWQMPKDITLLPFRGNFEDLRKWSLQEELCMLTTTGRKGDQAQKSELEKWSPEQTPKWGQEPWISPRWRTFRQHAGISPCTPDNRYNILPFPPPRCSALENIFHPFSLTVHQLKATVNRKPRLNRKGGRKWRAVKTIHSSDKSKP